MTNERRVHIKSRQASSNPLAQFTCVSHVRRTAVHVTYHAHDKSIVHSLSLAHSCLSSSCLVSFSAFFSRAGWTETARVYLKYAASLVTSPSNYDTVFSVGEFFHNVEENVDEGQVYFLRCGMMIVERLQELTAGKSNPSTKEDRKNARGRLSDVVGLIPDGPTQKKVLEQMWEAEMFPDLKRVIRKVGRRGGE